MPSVDIVVPCYNEEEGLDTFYTETTKVTNRIDGYSFRFIMTEAGIKPWTNSYSLPVSIRIFFTCPFPATSARKPPCMRD